MKTSTKCLSVSVQQCCWNNAILPKVQLILQCLQVEASFCEFFVSSIFAEVSKQCWALICVSKSPPCSGTAKMHNSIYTVHKYSLNSVSPKWKRTCFQKASNIEYTVCRWDEVEIYENGQCLCFDSRLNHSVERNNM